IWAKANQGRDIHEYATLDFRIGRQLDILNKDEATNFTVQLEDALGHLSNKISIDHYGIINGPISDSIVLKTVRIPLSAFLSIDLNKIRGVKFVIDKTKTGAIYLANIRIQRQLGIGSSIKPIMKEAISKTLEKSKIFFSEKQPVKEYVPNHLNSICSISVAKP